MGDDESRSMDDIDDDDDDDNDDLTHLVTITTSHPHLALLPQILSLSTP
jgi:hypothetical protein